MLVSASSALPTVAEIRRSPLWPDPREHGGRRDTSVALALLGESAVAPDFTHLPDREPPGSTYFTRAILRSRGELSDYWGQPGQAEAETGVKILKEALDHVFPKLRAVWEGANANHIFRSWYSILPPNRSFFRSWLLAATALLVLIGWVWLTLQLPS